jgi:hypothetical protein
VVFDYPPISAGPLAGNLQPTSRSFGSKREFNGVESVSHSQENLFTLKETLLVLPEKDRLFVEDILDGKNPNNSKESQETSARILRALMDRKGG